MGRPKLILKNRKNGFRANVFRANVIDSVFVEIYRHLNSENSFIRNEVNLKDVQELHQKVTDTQLPSDRKMNFGINFRRKLAL